MAEVLGLVASGISVAQLASGVTNNIIKLRDYWKQVKDAPAELNHLLREIDSLNLILSHIQDDQSNQTSPGLAGNNICLQQSLALCREGADELQNLVGELADKIDGKSGWRKRAGAAKVVLKKETIKTLKGRMKNAIRLLSLSYQLHTNAMIQLQPDIIVTRVSTYIMTNNVKDAGSEGRDHVQTTDQQKIESVSKTKDLVARQYAHWTASSSWLRYLLGSFEYRKYEYKDKTNARQEIRATLQAPGWWSSRVWDCKGYDTLSGWRLHLHTYRLIPGDSPFFAAVYQGDICSVQRILANKEGFVTDRFMENFVHLQVSKTALHVAAENGDVEMCRLLLFEGADPLAVDDWNHTPFHNLLASTALLQYQRQGRVIPTLLELLKAGAADLLVANSSILGFYRGSKKVFHFLQQQSYPNYYDLPPQDRFDLVASVSSRSSWGNLPTLMTHALDKDEKIGSEMLTLTNKDNQTLLHLFAYTFPTSYRNQSVTQSLALSDRDGDDHGLIEEMELAYATEDNTWERCITATMAAGANLHALDSLHRTPLSTLINSVRVQPHQGPGLKVPETPKFYIKSWLSCLAAAGIDLQKYGRDEKLAWKFWHAHEDVLSCSCVTIYDVPLHFTTCKFPFRLIGFDYGPRPEDWIFWLSDPRDGFAGDFWAMVERAEEEEAKYRQINVPGAWTPETEN